jgi:glycerophosphoryl diester phosphodiesterase
MTMRDRFRPRTVRQWLVVSLAVILTLGVTVTAESGASVATNPFAGLRRPLVIGHRGASGYRPEHTLSAYRLAIELGADFVEPDLVSTKDHQLVARHEPEISETTDVAAHSEFANRRTTKTIDGAAVTGWFTDDFTLAELRTLRAVERLPALRPANTAFNGVDHIPTFQEVIDLAKQSGVGIYPETKHPTYFADKGLALEEPLVDTLKANGYTEGWSPVFIQSFETTNLRKLRTMTRVRLVQLLGGPAARPFDLVVKGDPRTYGDLMKPAGLQDVATYANGIGPAKDSIIPRDAAGRLLKPTALVSDAHRVGLVVHPYTFRRENSFLPADFRQGNPASPVFAQATGDFPGELRLFLGLGIDGLFTDNADVAVAVRSTLG